LYGRVLKASFGIRFKRKLKVVEDWVDRCRLHIAAILERSDDFERKRECLEKKKKEGKKNKW